jgi:GNAT superfamily N-acetyltransferase
MAPDAPPFPSLNMKPLLILGPSSERWPQVEDLLRHEDAAWLDDLRARMVGGIDGARDAFAIIPEGSQSLAGACIRRRHEVGVLGHLFTRPTHRQRGHARSLLQALLSWFDMSGGKWLYVTSPSDLVENLFEKFGFQPLRRGDQAESGRVTMLRTPTHAKATPFEEIGGRATVGDVSPADWALVVALLQHHCGPDPRIGLDESALSAEATALELVTQQRQGACRLKGVWRQRRIVGLGSVATGQPGQRTYAMLLPHDRPPEGLREAVLELTSTLGFTQVDFPMEALESPPRS